MVAQADVPQKGQTYATPHATLDSGLTLQPLCVKVSASLFHETYIEKQLRIYVCMSKQYSISICCA